MESFNSAESLDEEIKLRLGTTSTAAQSTEHLDMLPDLTPEEVEQFKRLNQESYGSS